MRLRAELAALAAAACIAAFTAGAQPEAREPGREDIERALEQVASDPNLAPEQTIRMLRWVTDESASTDEPAWLAWLEPLGRWLRGLFGWLAESGRLLVWVVGGILAALLVVYLVKLIGQRGRSRALQPAAAAPSHVRDLDIRPESLPEDVGAEALERWSRGERRAALALLYRGLLSRLVHAYQVPIRASSTEGECLALAAPRLPPPSASYAARVIDVWQGAVYGGVSPPAGTVESLCTEFGVVLDARG